MGNPTLKLSAMLVLAPPACVTNGKTAPMCPPTPICRGAPTVSVEALPPAPLPLGGGTAGLLAGAGCALLGCAEATVTDACAAPAGAAVLVLLPGVPVGGTVPAAEAADGSVAGAGCATFPCQDP